MRSLIVEYSPWGHDLPRDKENNDNEIEAEY